MAPDWHKAPYWDTMRENLRVTNWREGLGTMTEERAWTTFAEKVGT